MTALLRSEMSKDALLNVRMVAENGKKTDAAAFLAATSKGLLQAFNAGEAMTDR